MLLLWLVVLVNFLKIRHTKNFIFSVLFRGFFSNFFRYFKWKKKFFFFFFFSNSKLFFLFNVFLSTSYYFESPIIFFKFTFRISSAETLYFCFMSPSKFLQISPSITVTSELDLWGFCICTDALCSLQKRVKLLHHLAILINDCFNKI